ICKDDIFACKDDSSLRLPGATVTLDDGRVQTVGSDAFYDFNNITPRYACVTVKKSGYKTKKKCILDDPADQPTYNSVALEPGTDPIDAGVDDANGGGDDASTGGDGGTHGDGGATNPGMGPGGPGCCQTGQGPPALLAGLVAIALRRRRRRF